MIAFNFEKMIVIKIIFMKMILIDPYHHIVSYAIIIDINSLILLVCFQFFS